MKDLQIEFLIFAQLFAIFRDLTLRDQVLVRVIHGPKDRVTPFDLKVQTFRVNVEFSTYHHEQKKIEKMSESDLSARKKIFWKFI